MAANSNSSVRAKLRRLLRKLNGTDQIYFCFYDENLAFMEPDDVMIPRYGLVDENCHDYDFSNYNTLTFILHSLNLENKWETHIAAPLEGYTFEMATRLMRAADLNVAAPWIHICPGCEHTGWFHMILLNQWNQALSNVFLRYFVDRISTIDTFTYEQR